MTSNIEKTEWKLQLLLDEGKTLLLLKTGPENRSHRYKLELDEQAEETIHSMIERCTKAMLMKDFHTMF